MYKINLNSNLIMLLKNVSLNNIFNYFYQLVYILILFRLDQINKQLIIFIIKIIYSI